MQNIVMYTFCVVAAIFLATHSPLPAQTKSITIPKIDYTANAHDYSYKAIIIRVKDGDTVVVDVDLGFDIFLKNVDVRLLGVYAPETYRPKSTEEKEAGMMVKQFVMNRLQPGTEIVLKTKKDRKDKYGRCLAVLFDGGGDINADILEFMSANKIKPNK